MDGIAVVVVVEVISEVDILLQGAEVVVAFTGVIMVRLAVLGAAVIGALVAGIAVLELVVIYLELVLELVAIYFFVADIVLNNPRSLDPLLFLVSDHNYCCLTKNGQCGLLLANPGRCNSTGSATIDYRLAQRFG